MAQDYEGSSYREEVQDIGIDIREEVSGRVDSKVWSRRLDCIESRGRVGKPSFCQECLSRFCLLRSCFAPRIFLIFCLIGVGTPALHRQHVSRQSRSSASAKVRSRLRKAGRKRLECRSWGLSCTQPRLSGGGGLAPSDTRGPDPSDLPFTRYRAARLGVWRRCTSVEFVRTALVTVPRFLAAALGRRCRLRGMYR